MVPPEYAMTALLHDAAEAYLADVPAPVKRCLPEYAEVEYRLMEFILQMFNAPMPDDILHKYDTHLGNLEAWTYMGPYRNTPHFNIWLPCTFGFLNREDLKMLDSPMPSNAAELSFIWAFDMLENRANERNIEKQKGTASLPQVFIDAFPDR